MENARKSESPLLTISGDDAARYGIADGGTVRIRSMHGEVVAQANVETRIRRGVVHLPHGWPQTNVAELLTTRTVDPLTTQPQISAFPVEIEIVEPVTQ